MKIRPGEEMDIAGFVVTFVVTKLFSGSFSVFSLMKRGGGGNGVGGSRAT